MRTADRLVTWVLETVCTAIGTCLIMGVLGVTLWRDPYLQPHNPFLAIAEFLIVVPIVLFYFGVTGYLFTTGYAAIKLRTRTKWFYPCTVAILYLFHSQVLLLGLGNRLLSATSFISVAGAFISFCCASAGNRLIAWRSGHT